MDTLRILTNHELLEISADESDSGIFSTTIQPPYNLLKISRFILRRSADPMVLTAKLVRGVSPIYDGGTVILRCQLLSL